MFAHKTFYHEPIVQVRQYNDKVNPKIPEYYLLGKCESISYINSINLKSTYLNEKYHIKIYYLSCDKKFYSRIYLRENFSPNFIFIKIENRLGGYGGSTNIRSMRFVIKYDRFNNLNENTLLQEIKNSGYFNSIKAKLGINFAVDKSDYFLVEKFIIYPEDMCNRKFEIMDQSYFKELMETQKQNFNTIKNMKVGGILPNM